MIQKRYQYRSKDGIAWTKWFNTDVKGLKYQAGTKLLNEYREVEDNK